MARLTRNWFALGLVAALVLGQGFAPPLTPLAQARWLTQSIVATVMFAMALPLEFREIRRVLRRPIAPLWASAVSLGLAPLLAWPLARWLGVELGPGLIVAAATPSTLASATVWTRKAGGNDSVSMLVTLVTNGTCFIVTPLWVRALTTRDVEPIPVGPLMLQLFLAVLLPIVLAQVLRSSRRVARWGTNLKVALGVYAQAGVLTMVTLGIAQMSSRLAESSAVPLTAIQLLGCGGVALAIHLALFAVGWFGGIMLRLNRGDRIAVGFSGSQKTLMVGLSIALQLKLSPIPLIFYHILQLLVDTVLAAMLRGRGSTADKSIVDYGPD
jgi:sodium/bile acid cotransporter 7